MLAGSGLTLVELSSIAMLQDLGWICNVGVLAGWVLSPVSMDSSKEESTGALLGLVCEPICFGSSLVESIYSEKIQETNFTPSTDKLPQKRDSGVLQKATTWLVSWEQNFEVYPFKISYLA